MRIVPLDQAHVESVRELMAAGQPFVQVRTLSDYWLYSRLFSASCPVAITDDVVGGVLIAFRSQTDPDEVYIQDVMVHPGYRRRGVAQRLMQAVIDQAISWGCGRLYLTSEPANRGARATWTRLGFTNVAGDYDVDGVLVIRDFKGPGKDRAVYERALR